MAPDVLSVPFRGFSSENSLRRFSEKNKPKIQQNVRSHAPFLRYIVSVIAIIRWILAVDIFISISRILAVHVLVSIR